MTISQESQPRLRRGCRFSELSGQDDILLIPEGLIKLAGPGRKILELCDGERTFAQILSALHSVYPGAPPEQVEHDTASYLEGLRARGAVEF
jgi:coenzyme PQQ biosynthesis protein PqqD